MQAQVPGAGTTFMDALTLAFVIFLLLAGLLLTTAVYRDTNGGAHGKAAGESERTRHLRDLRRMERRRDRVWWRVEELHAEFVERTEAGPPPRPARSEAVRPTGGRVPAGGLTPADVREAFEEFLRRG